MKLLVREADRLVFRMNAREKTLMERLLSFYPLQTETVASLNKNGDARLEEADQLLVDALKEQKKELTAWLARRVCEGEAFVESGGHWKLTLTGGDVERMLQVLNELRVGSWVKLGRPTNLDDVAVGASLSGAPLHALMMLTGQFQMVLVSAMNGDLEPPPAGES